MMFRFIIGGYFDTNNEKTKKAKLLHYNEYNILSEFGDVKVLPVANKSD